MTEVPPLPPRPSLDDPPASKPGAWLGMFLAAFFGFFCLVAISLLTLGYAGVIAAVVAVVFGVIAFHYMVWGWWLTALIQRDEVEKNTRDPDDSLPEA